MDQVEEGRRRRGRANTGAVGDGALGQERLATAHVDAHAAGLIAPVVGARDGLVLAMEGVQELNGNGGELGVETHVDGGQLLDLAQRGGKTL